MAERTPTVNTSPLLLRGLEYLTAHPGGCPTRPQGAALIAERCARVVYRDHGPDHWHLTQRGRDIAERLGVGA